jgi:hypothetical protein
MISFSVISAQSPVSEIKGIKNSQTSVSLSEVHGSVKISKTYGMIKRFLAFAGLRILLALAIWIRKTEHRIKKGRLIKRPNHESSISILVFLLKMINYIKNVIK